MQRSRRKKRTNDDLQNTTNKAKDRTRTSIYTGGNMMFSGRVGRSDSTLGVI